MLEHKIRINATPPGLPVLRDKYILDESDHVKQSKSSLAFTVLLKHKYLLKSAFNRQQWVPLEEPIWPINMSISSHSTIYRSTYAIFRQCIMTTKAKNPF